MSTEPGRDPSALSRERFDLFIIGGGITGACLAWDACLRGLRVALVDQADFGAATSSATSKLIHGGLRYLKNGELGLVRESLRERRVLQAIAPHLVWPLAFMIPTYKTGNVRWMIKAGMLAYDLLSFDRNRAMDAEHRMPGHEGLSVAQVLEREPGVDPRDLTGGAIYYDGQCNPDRLTLEFILGAMDLGAVCVNYAKVRQVARRDGGVELEVVDRLSGQSHAVEARMAANTAGPWADEVDHLFGTGQDLALVRSKGIHIVTRKIHRDHALVLRTDAGRHFFILPWRDLSLIGTTDTKYEGAVADLAVSDEDVQDFLDEINGAYPSGALTMDDVVYRYAGVRPLVEQDTQVYQASRRYEIVDHHREGHKGLISAVGGKYTTSRNLAEKLTDRILIDLNRPAVDCLTEQRPLPGAAPGRFADYIADRVANAKGPLTPESVEHLVWTYGKRHELIVDMVAADPALAEPIAEGRREVLAEAAFAVEHERALTLCDALIRRTGLGILGHPGQAALDKLTAVVADRLGWDAARKQAEQAAFAAKVLGQPERPFPEAEQAPAAGPGGDSSID